MVYPEIKIAKRLAKKHGLKPPVEIWAFVAKFAEIEETVLPVDADAISINLKNEDRKPQAKHEARKLVLKHAFQGCKLPTNWISIEEERKRDLIRPSRRWLIE